jgi:hypothetical protein
MACLKEVKNTRPEHVALWSPLEGGQKRALRPRDCGSNGVLEYWSTDERRMLSIQKATQTRPLVGVPEVYQVPFFPSLHSSTTPLLHVKETLMNGIAIVSGYAHRTWFSEMK